MNNLPKKALFDRNIPKKMFYENMEISPKIKEKFIDEIKAIRWKYKLAESTIGIKKGQAVEEIQIFDVKLKQKDLDETVLEQIDKQIPYYIVFILHFEEEMRLAIAYKEAAKNNAYKVKKIYYTPWKKELVNLPIEGFTLDKVYENFVKNIAGNQLQAKPEQTLAEAVEVDKKLAKKYKELEKLEKKKSRTKQFNKKMAIRDQIIALKKEIKSIE